MKIQLSNGILCKEKVQKKPAVTNTIASRPVAANTLSFMSIPSVAFLGKLVVPTLPKNINPEAKPRIELGNKQGLNELDTKPAVGYKVYPQDPLVTKPEMYKLQGEVKPGPESTRIKTVDKSEVATVNDKGNFNYDPESPQFARVNAYLFAAKPLQMYEDALGRKLSWAFPNEQIKIHPLAGVTMNAYYSRFDQEIKLFYFQDKFKPEETCYTSKMADVVTHETGHAVLDGLRPGYLGWGYHGGALHEGFSDTTAMLVAMTNDGILERVVKETGGNLKKENLIASLAEQFGKAYFGNKMYLRNAINDLKMSDYDSGRESKQVHNFGRLYGGVMYDIICESAMMHSKNMSLVDALKQTRDDLTKIFARAHGDFAPPGNVYYKDAGLALLQAEKTDFGGKYSKVLEKVLLDREILSPAEIKEFKTAKLPEVKLPSQALTDKHGIEDFVNNNKAKLNLPDANNYKVASAYNNAFGETFLQLKAVKDVKVPYGNEVYTINLYDGVTLAFDKKGDLFYSGVNGTTKNEIKEAVADAVSHLDAMKKQQDSGVTNAQPTVYKMPDGSNVLIKVPKTEDPVGI